MMNDHNATNSFAESHSRALFVTWAVVVSLLVIWSIMMLFFRPSENIDGRMIRIQSDMGEIVMSSEKSRVIHITGPLGTTEIELTESGARIVSSPCPEKICVKTGIISMERPAVCVPNRVSVSLE